MEHSEVTDILDDVATTNTKAKTKRPRKASPSMWCDASVAKLFSLRYNSHISDRFNCKNNAEKRVAYLMLASELSVAMEREFTVGQIQDMLSKMRASWALSKPSNPKPTGNLPAPPPPLHYEIMEEYWGSKLGLQRDSLMTTDGVDDTELEEQSYRMEKESTKEYSDESSFEIHQPTQKKIKKSSRDGKAKSQGDSLEAGFNAIKEGLVFLGSSFAAAQAAPATTNPSSATLDDVMSAIKTQNETLTKLLNHLISEKSNK
ncbi:hypothetical protein Ae201684P_011771 [Aphanomyces euteiches]|nr:hypothetical protein Ae201684P_011771 [Aphanomyces euteiches]